MPQVSVILPTYNRQQFLADAIYSILEQTETDLELIVADDGSTDGTAGLVEKIRQQDERVIYLPLPHTGRSHARNQALNIARGDYIAFQDSDDVSLPERLAIQLALLKSQPGLGMVYCSTKYMDAEGNPLERDYIVEPTEDLYTEIILKNYQAVIPMTAMLRRPAADKVGGFDENLDRFEDLDFVLRVAREYPCQAIVQPLYKARAHDENAMPSQKPQEVLRNLDRYAEKVINEDMGRTPPELLRFALARLYQMYGKETSKFFSIPAFTPFFRRAFALSPSLKLVVWYLLAVTGLMEAVENYLRQRSRSKENNAAS